MLNFALMLTLKQMQSANVNKALGMKRNERYCVVLILNGKHELSHIILKKEIISYI